MLNPNQKKFLKRTSAALVAAIGVCSLIGCGNNNEETNSVKNDIPSWEEPSDQRSESTIVIPENKTYYEESPQAEPEEEQKVLQEQSEPPKPSSEPTATPLETTEATPSPNEAKDSKKIVVNSEYRQEFPEVDCATENCLAITLDDGPGPIANDRRLLELLGKYGARATFYLVGYRIEDFPDWAQSAEAMIDQGHEIGAHTYDHSYLGKMTKSEIEEDTNKTNKIIIDQLGVYPRTVRPAYGSYTQDVNDVLAQQGQVNAMWSIDTVDYSNESKADPVALGQKMVQDVVKSIEQGEDPILLAHSIHMTTADALEFAIPKLVEAKNKDGEPLNIRFVTVSQMFGPQLDQFAGEVVCSYPYKPEIDDCYNTPVQATN